MSGREHGRDARSTGPRPCLGRRTDTVDPRGRPSARSPPRRRPDGRRRRPRPPRATVRPSSPPTMGHVLAVLGPQDLPVHDTTPARLAALPPLATRASVLAAAAWASRTRRLVTGEPLGREHAVVDRSSHRAARLGPCRQSANRQRPRAPSTSANASMRPASRLAAGHARARASPGCPGGTRRSRAARACEPSSCGGRDRRRRGPSRVVEALLADERVDQGRLADARRPEERDGGPGTGRCDGERCDALTRPRAHREDRGAAPRRGSARRSASARPSRRSALFTTMTGSAPLRPGHGEVALEASGVQVAPDRGDEQDRVHVRGDDLLAAGRGRALDGRSSPPGQDRDDAVAAPIVGAVADRHPVADGGHEAAGRAARRSAPDADGPDGAVGGLHVPCSAMLCDHAARRPGCRAATRWPRPPAPRRPPPPDPSPTRRARRRHRALRGGSAPRSDADGTTGTRRPQGRSRASAGGRSAPCGA